MHTIHRSICCSRARRAACRLNLDLGLRTGAGGTVQAAGGARARQSPGPAKNFQLPVFRRGFGGKTGTFFRQMTKIDDCGKTFFRFCRFSVLIISRNLKNRARDWSKGPVFSFPPLYKKWPKFHENFFFALLYM